MDTNNDRHLRLLENEQVTQLLIDSGITVLNGAHYAFARAVEDAVIRAYTDVALQFAMRMDRGLQLHHVNDEAFAAIVKRYEDAGDTGNADIIRKQWDVARAAAAGSQVHPESALPSVSNYAAGEEGRAS